VTGTLSEAAGRTEITAEVPAIELVRYATDLRSMAHGSGEFHRSYHHHAPMPHARAEAELAGSHG
jgi:elongation factor G